MKTFDDMAQGALHDDDGAEIRTMQCPNCGHRCESTGIGAVYCGPHGIGDEPHQMFEPARRMEEIGARRC